MCKYSDNIDLTDKILIFSQILNFCLQNLDCVRYENATSVETLPCLSSLLLLSLVLVLVLLLLLLFWLRGQRPFSVIFILYASISCNCDISYENDFWSRFWIPPQIFAEFIYAKLQIVVLLQDWTWNLPKLRSAVDRVWVRARVRLGLVSSYVSSG